MKRYAIVDIATNKEAGIQKDANLAVSGRLFSKAQDAVDAINDALRTNIDVIVRSFADIDYYRFDDEVYIDSAEYVMVTKEDVILKGKAAVVIVDITETTRIK